MKKEKIENIVLIIFIFTAIFSLIIIKPLGDLDELWNYNTARVITQGLIPYKEITMITTPLLPAITSVFLKIIANEILISRILTALLCTGIIYITFKILKLLIKNKDICLICIAGIGILFKDIFAIDYNFVVLLIALIILYSELKENMQKENKLNIKKEIAIGVLAGLAICTKQSIGITLAIVVVVYKLMFIENTNQFTQYIKNTIAKICGILLPIVLFLIYLLLTNSIKDFIDYAVLGISTFSNKIPYLNLLNNNKLAIKALAVIVPISIIINAIYIIYASIFNSKNKNLKNIITLFSYSLSIIIVMYPISDEIHFLIGSLIAIISCIYLIYLSVIKIYNKITIHKKHLIMKVIVIFVWILLFATILYTILVNYYQYIESEKNNSIEHYKYIHVPEYLQDRINEIDNYILEQEEYGNKVYILDAEAVVYMIPINKYNKNYDMFLKGNIGNNGQEKIIQEIKNKQDNTIILIRRKNLQLNWQTPTEIIEFVRENLSQIGEVSIFEIYK